MKFSTKALGLVAAVVSVASTTSLVWGQAAEKDLRPPISSQSTVKFQPLNIKPGLWESTRTIKRTGQLPIPAEMLNRLTPEQRARMEERMNANSAAHSSTATDKHCITKEDLEKDRLKLAETNECTTTVLNSTATNVKAKFVCETEGMQATGLLELVAADSEHLNGTYHSTANGEGHTMNVEGTWSSKWLGSSCANAK
jgi:hypothetical protein